jgi:hypothetical protein
VSFLIAHSSKILVAPLNWGLGHATRCVPIVRALLAEDKEVVLAGEGFVLEFLKKEFPHLQTIEFKGISIKYSSANSQVWAILRQIPKIFFAIIKEHFELKKIIETHNIKCVISDNRFGLWNKKIYTIYITHQILIKLPEKFSWLEKITYHIHNQYIKKYNECWIPDFADENNLSGDLSHKYPPPKNAKFIGILSRFS